MGTRVFGACVGRIGVAGHENRAVLSNARQQGVVKDRPERGAAAGRGAWLACSLLFVENGRGAAESPRLR